MDKNESHEFVKTFLLYCDLERKLDSSLTKLDELSEQTMTLGIQTNKIISLLKQYQDVAKMLADELEGFLEVEYSHPWKTNPALVAYKALVGEK